MDGEQFDTWTKTLNAGTASRRVALRRLAGAVLGGSLALLDLGDGAAKKRKKKKKKCDKGEKRCGGTCIPEDDCCVNGKRVPPGRYRQCGWCDFGVLSTTFCDHIDPDGCSVCLSDFQCYPGNEGMLCFSKDLSGKEFCGFCQSGLCEPTGEFCAADCCQQGETCCGGNFCADLQNSILTCGSCDHSCIGEGAFCAGGQCQCQSGNRLCPWSERWDACCPDDYTCCSRGSPDACCLTATSYCCAQGCCSR
jgi:hypothetical protein